MTACRNVSASVVSPVFVGRAVELAALDAALAAAADGQPGVVLVGGEAGVGKTRLLDEFTTRATAAGFVVLVGHCIELGADGLPLAPLVDALRALARGRTTAELAELFGPTRRGLARLLPELDPDVVTPPVAFCETAQGMSGMLVIGVFPPLGDVTPDVATPGIAVGEAGTPGAELPGAIACACTGANAASHRMAARKNRRSIALSLAVGAT